MSTNQNLTPDFSALVQQLQAAQAKSNKLVADSKKDIGKMGRVRRSMEKLADAMSEENTFKTTDAAVKRRKSKVAK